MDKFPFTITIEVTAKDGATKESYAMEVDEPAGPARAPAPGPAPPPPAPAPAGDATLKELTISAGKLEPVSAAHCSCIDIFLAIHDSHMWMAK